MSTKGRHYTRVHGQQGPIAEMSEECETLGERVHAIDLQRSKPNIQSGGCYSRAVQEQIDSGTKEQAVNSQTEEPTPASVWQSLTGRTISDEFLDCPSPCCAVCRTGGRHYACLPCLRGSRPNRRCCRGCTLRRPDRRLYARARWPTTQHSLGGAICERVGG